MTFLLPVLRHDLGAAIVRIFGIGRTDGGRGETHRVFGTLGERSGDRDFSDLIAFARHGRWGESCWGYSRHRYPTSGRLCFGVDSPPSQRLGEVPRKL